MLTQRQIEGYKKRRVPKRTKTWNENIGKALRKGFFRECLCGKKHWVHPYEANRAKYCSMVCQRRFRKYDQLVGKSTLKGSLAKLGEKNPMWAKLKAKPSLGALHQYIRKRLIKPINCQHCGLEKSLDMANKSQEYKRDLTDWLWLCRKCHLKYDGRKPPTTKGKRLDKQTRKFRFTEDAGVANR